MLFNSLSFAVFFVFVFLTYWLFPNKYRWLLLLVSSYCFYMSGNAKHILLIVFITVISYADAIVIDKCQTIRLRRFSLIIGILSCLGVLIFFKYFNFFSDTLTDIFAFFAFPVDMPVVKVLLPVGISFYTFQAMSYLIDVYRGKSVAEYNLGIYAAFISFFPQLVAGPIERTEDLLPQIRREKQFDYDMAMHGIGMMLWGYFKKIAVADVLAVYVDRVYENVFVYSGFELAIAVFFFTVQIYCDFSGYSDIALGTAELLGIKLMTNFRSPYFSASIKQYWSRWHISLSTWFRDYVYIPLGGNRCSKIKHYFNLVVTFLVSGLWHGANWTFVVWGGIHGIAQIGEELLESNLKKIRSKREGKIILTAAVFLFCNLAWVFFRADSMTEAFYVLSHMLDNIWNPSVYLHNTIGLSIGTLLFILVLIGIVAAYDYFSIRTDILSTIMKKHKIVGILGGYVLISFIVWGLFHNAGTNSFVYFQF